MAMMIGLFALLTAGLSLPAQAAPPVVRDDGTVEIQAYNLPPSDYMSPEAQELLRRRAKSPEALPADLEDRPDKLQERYPFVMEERTIAGVPVRVFTPLGKPHDRKRVLMNFHGGGFVCCFDMASRAESIPVAVLGGYKVISPDYRQAPQFRHPAALEDAVAVYRELLKTYPARRIGAYGCSAGGTLTSQFASWLVQNDMPMPGAIGIFGSGAGFLGAGDSAYFAGSLMGVFPSLSTSGYFAGVDRTDRTNAPVRYPEILARFPPTMIITGTRSPDMSTAVHANTQLLRQGVDTTLIVGEGMEHCYIGNSDLPEARDAQQLAVNFFRKHLGN